MSSPRYLIVSAWWPEQRALHAAVNSLATIETRGHMVALCASEIEWLRTLAHLPQKSLAEVDFLCCGVGPVNAAIEVTSALTRCKYDKVFFCGTAGSYHESTPNLSVVHCTRAAATDAGVVTGVSYLPQVERMTAEVVSKDGAMANGPLCISSFSITRSDDLSAALASMAHLENLEFYGLARACARADVPFEGVFGISNRVGSTSHEEWKLSHVDASLKAQQACYAAISGGGVSSGGV